jgi:hypothetical protein
MSPRHARVSRTASGDPVVEWRRGRLCAAGFPAELAAELAGDGEIDLHAVLDLIDRGCTPELAARILAPLPSGTRWSA